MATYLRDHLEATKDSVECTGTATPPITPLGYAQTLGQLLWDLQYPIPFGRTISSRYLAVHSNLAPVTPCRCPGQVQAHTKYGS